MQYVKIKFIKFNKYLEHIMEKPFILINGRLTKRTEFNITDGVQPTYAFLYIKSGSFSLSLHGKKTVVCQGDSVIFSDKEHFKRSVTKEIEFIYVQFKINLNCTFLPTIPTGKIIFKDKERFLSTITSYEKLLPNKTPQGLYLKQHLFEDILLQVSIEHSGLTAHDNAKINDHLLNHVISYLEKNLDKKISISDLCKVVATNHSTLNFRFRRAFNCSTGDYIIKFKMENAKKLLLTSAYNVGEIAYRLGFENQYYFSTAFKKKEGLSPTAFRLKHGI